MLKNYFKIAWRNLFKNKLYSGINILGLAAGMAVAILIALWIWDEVTFRLLPYASQTAGPGNDNIL